MSAEDKPALVLNSLPQGSLIPRNTYSNVPPKKRPFLNSPSQSVDETAIHKKRKKEEVMRSSSFSIESLLRSRPAAEPSTNWSPVSPFDDIPLLDFDSSYVASTSEESSNEFCFDAQQSMQDKVDFGFSASKDNSSIAKDDLPMEENTLPSSSMPPLPKMKIKRVPSVAASTHSYVAEIAEVSQPRYGDCPTSPPISTSESDSTFESTLQNTSVESDSACNQNPTPLDIQTDTPTNDCDNDNAAKFLSELSAIFPDSNDTAKSKVEIKIEKPAPEKKKEAVKVPTTIIDLTLDDDEPEPFPIARPAKPKKATDAQCIDLTNANSPEAALPAPNATECSQVENAIKDMTAAEDITKFIMKYFLTFGGPNAMPANVMLQASFLGYKISGPKPDVEKAEMILKNVKWHEDKISFCCPKLSSHFFSESWKDFQKVLESETRCVVEIKHQNDTAEKSSENSETKPEPQEQCTALATLPSSSNEDAKNFFPRMDDRIPAIRAKIQPGTIAVPVLPSSSYVDIPLLLDDSAKQVNYGQLSVIVCKGDITEEYTDAIVNGVINNFDFSQGATSRAVVQKGGKEIPMECFYRSSGEFGPFVRVTGGYALNCKHVINIITPTNINEYAPRILLALQVAETLRYQSVSIPTIGTGGFQLNPSLVAQSMATAFEQFVQLRPVSLKTIKVVIYDLGVLSIFMSNIVTSKEKRSYGYNRVLSLEAQIKSMAMSDYAVVCVKSDSSSSVAKAKDRILSHMNNHVTERKLDNEILKKLGDHDFVDIYEASIKHQVKIDNEPQQGSYEKPADFKELAGIYLYGLNDRVNRLHDHIRELWYELREAETMAKMCVWKWEVVDQKFEDLPFRVSREIEKCYETNNQGICDVRLFGETLKVNFSTMTYSFLSDGGKIQRSGKETSSSSSLPADWIDMSDKPLLRVQLHPQTPEYQRVFNQFLKSRPVFSKIVRIERIQNVALYRQYEVMKSHVRKYLKSDKPVERELFHGTSEIDANNICAHGFNRSFVGKNGTAFGKGCYFAVHSSYSVGYTKRGGRGSRKELGYMFLSLVLTGDFTQGHAEMKSPPEKFSAGEEKHLYDSVVDNINNPSMFVVFKDSSVYPSYLVVFS